MSLIEKAVERLESIQGAPVPDRVVSGSAQETPTPAFGEGADAPRGGRTLTSEVKSRPPVVVDFARLAELGMVNPENPRSLIAEEFRVLKRPLLANVASPAAPVRNANLIMVTSSLPGEGKTFTAVNLAISIAMELDKTVLLVDADVARQSLPRVLGIESGAGLLDVLQNSSVQLSEVLVRTNLDKLRVLTAGTQQPNATELLASEAMGRLLDELARRYSDRIIVFDSPPLLATTEARALAARIGQIVLVVKAEETPQKAVSDALATIESCPVKLMVLNQAHNYQQVAYGYGYGYGY